MSVAFNSPVTSANTNAGFMDKNTANTSTVAIVALNNAVPSSGPTVANVQLEINKASPISIATLSLNNLSQITLQNIKGNQLVLVQGNSTSVILSSIPFVATDDFVDGAIVKLVGRSSLNTVTIIHNDIAGGAFLNGNATLENGYTLTLVYSLEADRWFEIDRNF